MKAYYVRFEMPDSFEPCTQGCENGCPFSEWVEYECGYVCVHKEYDHVAEEHKCPMTELNFRL